MKSNQSIIEQDDLTGLNNLPGKKLQTKIGKKLAREIPNIQTFHKKMLSILGC